MMKPVNYFERCSELSLERHGIRGIAFLTDEQRGNIISDVYAEMREYNKWKYNKQ